MAQSNAYKKSQRSSAAKSGIRSNRQPIGVNTLPNSFMDELPRINTACYGLPIKQVSFIIGINGFILGSIGILSVLSYEFGVADFTRRLIKNPSATASNLLTFAVGLISIMQTVKGLFLILGIIYKSRPLLYMFIWWELLTIMVAIVLFTFAPLLCLFRKNMCLFDFHSTSPTFVATFVFIFLCSWTYFVVVVNSFRMQMR